MKKIYNTFGLLFGLGLSLISTYSNAQDSGVFIHRELNPNVAYNGDTIRILGGNSVLYEMLYVQNITDQPQTYRWERIRLHASSTSINDQLCDDFYCVECIGDLWTAGHTMTINPSDSTLFKPQANFAYGGDALYKYFIKNNVGERIDSVMIRFSSTLNTPSVEPLPSVKVYPNPSTGVVTVKNAAVGSEIQFFDLLGKLYTQETIQGTAHSINLTNLPDGVYFYTIRQKNGVLLPAKKLILQK
jgi:hypothetical protein